LTGTAGDTREISMSGNDNPYSNSFGQMSATASYGSAPAVSAAAPAPVAGGYIKDTTTAAFPCRRHPGIAQPAGAGRFLGAVVRPLQATDPCDRKVVNEAPVAGSSWSR
jgi:putative thioredoxin